MTVPGEARAIAERFDLGGPIEGVVPVAGGHINHSYRIDVTGRADRYLLQRVNSAVFPHPDWVMHNVANVTRHLAASPGLAGRRTLILVPAQDGAAWVTTPDGACWRMYPFIPNAIVREHVGGPDDARAAGSAFGEFLRLVGDYDGPALYDTLPGFHDTVARFAQLESAVRRDPCGRAMGARAEIVAAMGVRGLADRLAPRLARLPRRIVHNDAKLSNVLLDERSGVPLCVIDLDTVMPGLVLHDFGDLVRSLTSPTAEDEADLTKVFVRPELFEAMAQGYLAAAGPVLSPEERELLVHGGQLIILEQAVRFLTDHLEGDRYYRISRPALNLIRCRTQLKLFSSAVESEAELAGIVSRCV